MTLKTDCSCLVTPPALACRLRSILATTLLAATALLAGCSTSEMVVRGSLAVMDGGIEAMNRETDLVLAEQAIPANLKFLEGLVVESPRNATLRLNMAQGLYGYAFAFVEDRDAPRAKALYTRGLEHASIALERAGLPREMLRMPQDLLRPALATLGKDAVPAMFWTASCIAKRADIARDDPAALAALPAAEALMARVLELDEGFYFGGAHLFFGAWYGGRPVFFGGDPLRAQQHFEAARRFTQDKLLIAYFLRALTLDVQLQDRAAFEADLGRAIDAPPDLFPEMALANAVAREKAKRLMGRKEMLF